VAFALLFGGFALAAAVLSSTAPLQLSIWTVFLFAGPHNWMEARYFLSRAPVRWTADRTFYIIAIAGVVLLALSFWSLPASSIAHALWQSLLAGWIALLYIVRRREIAATDGSGAMALACLWMAGAWLWPAGFDTALVYLHPFVSLWFLNRQIRRSRPEWLGAWSGCLALLAVLVVLLCWKLTRTPDLSASDAVATAIVWNAGAGVLPGVSSRLLVALHTFLETTHYAVWVFALPLLGLRTAPWRLRTIPLFCHRYGWPKLVRIFLLGGAAAVALLWLCFWLDYPATRSIYFTVAIIHVLAEAPFLLRLA
jgi:hypothetical protein